MKKKQIEDGSEVEYCVYTPHSLRATTATLLLDARVDIKKVQGLLGRRRITTTQIYDKRRIAASQSASHNVPNPGNNQCCGRSTIQNSDGPFGKVKVCFDLPKLLI